jgi:hypothetical protein
MGEIPEWTTELPVIAERNTMRLPGMVNDIHDMEKIDSSGMELILNLIDIRTLVEHSIQDNQAYTEQLASILDYRRTPYQGLYRTTRLSSYRPWKICYRTQPNSQPRAAK